ncbi:MAG: 50S ribosomal protein L3 [SAR202 cluster bacterium]|nr:50S ribosomal protein L3 [SAR202 cluster bacterium]|tara:strand:+ start:19352 stop:19972 length:621 start_codon:yes stop_codon:yes gene_type:complete
MKINGIIGKKLGMSLIYDDSGNMLPVTLVQAGPCTVTQVKTLAKDGYDSVQIGFSESKNLNSPQSGHQKRSGGQFSVLQEFQADDPDQIEVGQKITTEIFEENEKIKVSGTTKGRGFSGGVRRYGFKGGPKTHGQSDRHRAVGSIGAGSSPGRVWPGTRMPGRYGNEKATIKGLSIAKIDSKNNILVIKGSIPGHNGSNVRIEIQK